MNKENQLDYTPQAVRASGRELSVEEHYEILQMDKKQIKKKLKTRQPAKLLLKVKNTIAYWDGSERFRFQRFQMLDNINDLEDKLNNLIEKEIENIMSEKGGG